MTEQWLHFSATSLQRSTRESRVPACFSGEPYTTGDHSHYGSLNRHMPGAIASHHSKRPRTRLLQPRHATYSTSIGPHCIRGASGAIGGLTTTSALRTSRRREDGDWQMRRPSNRSQMSPHAQENDLDKAVMLDRRHGLDS